MMASLPVPNTDRGEPPPERGRLQRRGAIGEKQPDDRRGRGQRFEPLTAAPRHEILPVGFIGSPGALGLGAGRVIPRPFDEFGLFGGQADDAFGVCESGS